MFTPCFAISFATKRVGVVILQAAQSTAESGGHSLEVFASKVPLSMPCFCMLCAMHCFHQVSSHGEKAIFVHMYGPEPHPTVPDTNFDSGTLLPNYWSVASQTLTYEGRVASAEAIRSITHPSEVQCREKYIVVDLIIREYMCVHICGYTRRCTATCVECP